MMAKRSASLFILAAGFILLGGCVPRQCATAISDFFRIAAGSSDNTLNVRANDIISDEASNIQYSVVSGPQHGTLVLEDAVAGIFSYTPDANMPRNGYLADRDAFTYQLTSDCTDEDGNVQVAVSVARVVLLIQGSATPPAPPQCDANDNSAVTAPNTPVNINVLANDDPCATTIIAVTQPANGTVTPDPPTAGPLTYTPDAGFVGTDTFTYTINGGAQATVTVTVNAQSPDGPQNDFAFTIDADTDVTVNVLANDPSGSNLLGIVDPTTQQVVPGPVTLASGAVVTVSGNNSINYDPNGTTLTTDSFQYATQDGQATVTISIGDFSGVALGQVVLQNATSSSQTWSMSGANLIDPLTMLPATSPFQIAPQTAETFLVQLGPPGVGSATVTANVTSTAGGLQNTCTVFEILGQPNDSQTRMVRFVGNSACIIEPRQ